ncbi:MAG TPA: LysR family transcriptional regulator [Alphaproteobacteria bacterium]|nr:LysR family transcriptional regulator [Alphaproteobacteria bacterium]
MNFRQLNTFYALMRSRSTTEAARLLGISQPAVSKTLGLTEAMLGLKLFERINGRLHPTPEAERLYPAAEDIFTSLARFEAAANEVKDAQSGLVTMAAIPTLANAFLPEALRRFRGRRDRIRVAVKVLPTRQIVDLVAGARIDIGFVHDTVDTTLVRSDDLGDAEIVCIAPQGHPFAASAVVHARDLKPYPLVCYDPQSPFGARLVDAFRAVGENLDVAVEVGASSVLCALVERGVGVGLVEPYIVNKTTWPRLVSRPFHPRIRLRPRILTPLSRPVSALAKEFIAHYKAVVAQSIAR